MTGAVPGATELDLFETVDYLMEIEDEMCTVGDEETSSAVQAWRTMSVSE